MKKKYILFALSLGLLTACDPIKDEGTLDVDQITESKLLEGATFEQFAGVENEDGTITYTPASDGNYIQYSILTVPSVQIFYIKADGSEYSLTSGSAAGMFNFTPSRGSDPLQTVYFRYIDANGQETVASKQFTVAVAADLTPEVKLLASNSGQKVWKWNPYAIGGNEQSAGAVWGNMGSNGGHSGAGVALYGDNKWWGVKDATELMDQLQHTPDGQAHGDESLDATMVFTEDGMIYCYDANGTQFRSGKYQVKGYDPNYEQHSAYCGILHTDAGSILFPYEINSGGRMPTDFEIAYLSPGHMVLTYPDNGAWDAEGWSEGTYWEFYSTTDVEGILTDNDEATWEWDDEAGQCWGNAGYSGFASGSKSSLTGNTWWGITSADIAGQVSDYGYGFNDVAGTTMTFKADGTMSKSSGGSGSWSYDNKTNNLGGYVNDDGSQEFTVLGHLYTTGDGILFNQRINASNYDHPATISEFDIAWIDDNHLVLITPCTYKGDNADAASWMEGTFWRFKKK